MPTTPHLRTLISYHPHLSPPAIIGAPTRPYALHAVAVAVSLAGGLGFLSSTPNDTAELAAAAALFDKHPLPTRWSAARPQDASTAHDDAANPDPARPLLPVGIGYLCWMTDLDRALRDLTRHPLQAVWLFAWKDAAELTRWVGALRTHVPATTIYIQICTVAGALAVHASLGSPENLVLIAQGADAGGHGAVRGAGLGPLLPEVRDALAAHGWAAVPVLGAGGIVEARGAAAALALGAAGVVLGTRLLAAEECVAPEGFKRHVVAATDGGVSTVRTRLFDSLRGTAAFPAFYDGRALRNRSLAEEEEGVGREELGRRYRSAEERLKARGPKQGESGHHAPHGNDGLHALNEPQTQTKGSPPSDDEETFGPTGRLTAYAGTGVGLVDRIRPAGDIVRELRRGIVARVEALVGEMG